MVTAYTDLDEQIRETAYRTAREQGLPEQVTDDVVLGRIADAVGEWQPKSKSGTEETTDAA